MISVIVPIYNVEKYIKDCLDAIICQKYRKFELILIDDGSTDQSISIAKEVMRNLNDVPCQIIHTSNRGVSCARNEGIKQAKGEFIVMVDSDDIISPDFLSDYMKMVDNNANTDIYSSGFTILETSTNKRLTPEIKTENINEFTWDKAQKVFFDRTVKFLLPTLLFRRSFLIDNSIYFDEIVRYSEDVQFIWRCLAYNRKIVLHMEKSNYEYLLHPGSTMTASRLPKIETCASGLERLFIDIKENLSDELRDAFLPRMYFSMLHSSAKLITLKDFLKLYAKDDYEKYVQREVKSNSLKTKLVSSVLMTSPRTGYLLMRRF